MPSIVAWRRSIGGSMPDANCLIDKGKGFSGGDGRGEQRQAQDSTAQAQVQAGLGGNSTGGNKCAGVREELETINRSIGSTD